MEWHLDVDFRADGPGTVNPVAGSFTAGGSLKGGALTSNGVAVAVSLAGDVYTGKAGSVTVFTLTINDNGTVYVSTAGSAGSCGCRAILMILLR